MADIVDNLFQVCILSICTGIVTVKALRSKKREWMLLFMCYSLYMFSTLFYLLYKAYYIGEPSTHTSEIGWYVSYTSLVLLMNNVRDKGMDKVRYKVLWLIPVFTFGMGAFFVYISEGDYLSNIVAAVLMAVLIINALKGAIYCGREKKNYPEKLLYRSVLIFCTMEYLSWIASCIWFNADFTNPYYWFDMLITLSFVLFIPSVERVVER